MAPELFADDHNATTLLILLCEQRDLIAKHRGLLQREGVQMPDQRGAMKKHPSVSGVRDACETFLKLRRQLIELLDESTRRP